MTALSSLRSNHAYTMDRIYRRQRHIYNLTRKYYLLGRDDLLRQLDVPPGGRVLEVGCGTGRNLVRAALANPQGLFYGVDISAQMLDTAHTAASASRAAERIFLMQGDAEAFDAAAAFSLDGFDRAFFSYSLSMIPGWRTALALAVAQLKPDGQLLIVDFDTMEAWPAMARDVMRRWLARFHVAPCPDLARVVRQVAGETGRTATAHPIAGGYATMIAIGAVAGAGGTGR